MALSKGEMAMMFRGKNLNASTAMLALAIFATTPPAHAQEQRYEFDIPAQDLGSALKAFARIARQQVTFDSASVRGKRSRALKGSYPAQAAINALLASSGLRAESGSSGIFIVRPDTVMAAPPAVDEALAADEPKAIVVTGSRVRSANAVSISPISTVSSQDIAGHGIVRVEDLINTLPQAYATPGSSSRDGVSGGTTINLRNLGNQRTLVLIDGRRLLPGDPDSAVAQAPDINNIPAALISRVDIVTGGASAVYGSDAIAGVVNFVLKRDFTGLQLNAQNGLFVHNNNNAIARSLGDTGGRSMPTGVTADGRQTNIQATFGTNFADGRGNVTLYANYRQIEPVLAGDRDYTTCGLAATSSAGYSCVLSSSTSPARFQLSDPNTGLSRGAYTIDAATGNSFRTYLNSDGYNSSPDNNLHAPEKTLNLGMFAHYEVSPAVDIYTDLMFMRNRTVVQTSQVATFSAQFKINCSNPLLSASQRDLLCTSVGLGSDDSATVALGLRNASGSPVITDILHKSYRALVGTRGDLGGGWRYDVYAQYGRTDYKSDRQHDFSKARVQNALQVTTGADGTPTCITSGSGCVPLNIFSIGGVTSAALDYVEAEARTTGFTRERIVSGSIDGDIGIRSPFASHPVGVAIGAEYRDEALTLRPDSVWTSGDLTGGGSKVAVSGQYEIKEVFGELRVPLVDGHPFIRELALDTGIRYANYSNSGGATSYKIGGNWTPVAGLRARLSYQRAVRAPNVTELFSPQRSSFTVVTDPCQGTVPTATLAQCQQTGMTAAQYGTVPASSGQGLGTIIGGNPDLRPETSHSLSYGAVLMPAILPRLTVSVDYFRIKVKDLIGTIPMSLTLTQCINTGSPYFCNLIHRDPSTGSLVQSPTAYVITTNLNTGSLETRGIDFAASYQQPIGKLGQLGFNFAGTWTDTYMVQPLPDYPSYDCAGYFGVTCQQPVPTWRHRFIVDWNSLSGFALSATWRFVRGTRNDKSNSSSLLSGTYQAYDAKLPDVSYFDLSASVDVGPNYTFRLGANNVFDRDPPLTASLGGLAQNASFYAGMYDSLGRYIYASVNARF